MSLEDLEKELYGQAGSKKDSSPKKGQTPDNSEESFSAQPQVENPWQKARKPLEDNINGSTIKARTQTLGKVVIIGLIVILVGLLGFAGYYLYQFFTVRDVATQVILPDQVMVGEEFVVAVAFQNTSEKTLTQPTVSLALPSGALYTQDTQKRVVERVVDTIKAGEAIRQEFSIVIVGDPLQTYQFIGSVSYEYDGSSLSSRFEKEGKNTITARDPVIALDLSVPSNVFSGQDFEIHAAYDNQSNAVIEGARVYFEIPDMFVVNNTQPTLEDFAFVEQQIAPARESIAIVSGSVVGQEYSLFSISAGIQVSVGGNFYDIVKKTNSVSIIPSPLSLSVSLQGSDPILSPGQKVNYQLQYKNNSTVDLKDVVVEAVLVGDMVDESDVETRGFYNAANRSIVWTASTIPALATVNSGEQGLVSFSVGVDDNYPITRVSDKNFTITVRGKVSSPTVPTGSVAQETVGIAEITNLIKGRLAMKTSAYHNDVLSDIVNQGSLPPRVGDSTEYTIHWDLSALGADFENVQLSAFLGSGVEWTGKVVANTQATPSYNERTQEVAWNVGTVVAGSGVSSPATSAIIQVRITPSSAQRGDRMTLVARGTVRGRDVFVEKEVGFNLSSIETDDLNDGFLPSGYDRVQ